MNESNISRADALRVVQDARERGIVDLREIIAELKTLPVAADEYTAFLESEAAKATTRRCPNCGAALRPLHCCACEGCDGCREVAAATPVPPPDAVRKAAADEIAAWIFKLEKPLTSETDLQVAGQIVERIISRYLPVVEGDEK